MRREVQIRVDDEGQIEVVDPGFESLPLLRSVDPDFKIKRAGLPGFTLPRIRATRNTVCPVDRSELPTLDLDKLWEIHDAADVLLSTQNAAVYAERASLMAVKVEIARRLLGACTLCEYRCGVDRLNGELGRCLLGSEALIADHFVHIGEESPINPSLVINFAGCGLRCVFCQQHVLLDPRNVSGRRLDKDLWLKLDSRGARSLSFVGGNPDESVYAILGFLARAPQNWKLPVVWNTHAYSTTECLKLLRDVVDVYLPDFKYGNEPCGRRLSGIANYPKTAARSVRQMLGQGVTVVVRILILPNHNECCHFPTLETLASIANERLMVSVRGQYSPDWRISSKDGCLTRRPTRREVDAVIAYAKHLGLSVVV